MVMRHSDRRISLEVGLEKLPHCLQSPALNFKLFSKYIFFSLVRARNIYVSFLSHSASVLYLSGWIYLCRVAKCRVTKMYE